MSLIDDLKLQAQQEAGWVLAHDLYIADANFTILAAKLNPQGKFGPKWDLEIKVDAVFQDIDLTIPDSGKCSMSMGSNPTRDAFFRLLQPHLPVHNMSVDEAPTEKGNPYNDLVEITPGDDRYILPPKKIGRTPSHARIATKPVPPPPVRRPVTAKPEVVRHVPDSPSVVDEYPDDEYEELDEEDESTE